VGQSGEDAHKGRIGHRAYPTLNIFLTLIIIFIINSSLIASYDYHEPSRVENIDKLYIRDGIIIIYWDKIIKYTRPYHMLNDEVFHIIRYVRHEMKMGGIKYILMERYENYSYPENYDIKRRFDLTIYNNGLNGAAYFSLSRENVFEAIIYFKKHGTLLDNKYFESSTE
jgi:hypothetical protein